MYRFLPLIALTLVMLAAVLWKIGDHKRLRAALAFLGLSLVVWGAEALGSSRGLDTTAARQVAIALLGLAAVQVIAGAVFNFAVKRAKVPRFAGEMVVIACYLAIIARLLYSLGVNVTGLFATSAVATAVIGLALQDLMGNVASGIALEFEKDIHIGDFVRTEQTAGTVVHKRLRHTEIRTPDGDAVMLPNIFLTRSPFTVVGKAHRLFIPFTMPYATNPQELIDAVIFGLRSSPLPEVASEPPPSCIIQELATGQIRYAAVVFITNPARESITTSAVLNRIYFALKRAGIPVSEITTVVEMKPVSETEPTKVDPVVLLRRTLIFRHLDEANLYELGARMRHLSFAPGELVVRQGDAGESMYIMTAGQVAIRHVGRDNAETQVAVVSAGEFFGEASLLTGEARNANAVAISRVDCYELEKTGLQGILEQRPDLAEDMSVVVAHRQTQLAISRERLDAETARQREAEHQMQLLNRIRRFFGLNTSAASV
jgi:small-conductance mechanosensitive channel/CRP-like cAMP-binding protein